jgi:hypothetical protein
MAILSCNKEDVQPKQNSNYSVENTKSTVFPHDYEKTPTMTLVDENGQTSLIRDGEWLPTFYIGSVSSDSYTNLLPERVQEEFNTNIIDSITLIKYKNHYVAIEGVTHAYYNLKIKYIDSSIDTGRYFATYISDTIKYKPSVTSNFTKSNLNKSTVYIKTVPSVVTSYLETAVGGIQKKYKYNISTGKKKPYSLSYKDYQEPFLANNKFVIINHK